MIYCERKGSISKRQADPRSFRWVYSGRGKILIACPRGKWNASANKCRAGTRAYKILSKSKNGRCKPGAKKIRKDR